MGQRLARNQVQVAPGDTILLFLLPQVPKEFYRCWPMPRIVVVAEGKDFQDFGIAHQRFEYLDPIFQIGSAVDDGPIPRRCLLLNPFAVAQPAHISEVRRNSGVVRSEAHVDRKLVAAEALETKRIHHRRDWRPGK
jgi:hypothetical protein